MTKENTLSNKTSKKPVVTKQAAKARAATSYVEKPGNDLIEQCYAHVPNANSNISVVACTEYKRQ